MLIIEKISKYNKGLLLSLLVIINIIIRIPSVPHEVGNDSFTIHIMANSISLLGKAGWWVHPASIFGFYPYSYASAVPFILSGFSQITFIDMEITIWFFSLIIGLFSAFTAYILAGEIMKNDFFKFFVAISYSLSPGVLAFSTWDISTRGLFIVILPLTIYSLIKIYNIKTKLIIIKYIILFLMLIVLLMATHHYFFMTITFIAPFIFLIVFNTIQINKFFKLPNNLENFIVIIAFVGMFLLPFLTGMLISGSKYGALHYMIRNNIRYSGPLIIFAVSGIIYILFKDNKKIEEWYLFLTILGLTPLLYQETYTHFFAIIFICLLIGYSFINILKIQKYRKYAVFTIAIMLLISIGFSTFYQHWRSDIWGNRGNEVNSMKDDSYRTGLWIKYNINDTKKMVGYDELTARRIFAISEVPTLVGDSASAMLSYGFISKNNISASRNSPLKTAFYFDNPYKSNSVIEPYQDSYSLKGFKINSLTAEKYINKYNLTYVIENREDINTFSNSLNNVKNDIYDNGKIRIWSLD